MVITCSRCKAQYNLDQGQLSSLYYSMLICQGCQNVIKIAECPDCHTFYTISITAPQKSEYKVKCLKCFNQFSIQFPIDESATNREAGTGGAKAPQGEGASQAKQPFTGESQNERGTETDTRSESAGIETRGPVINDSAPAERNTRIQEDDRKYPRDRFHPSDQVPASGKIAGVPSISLSRLFKFTFGALSSHKLIAGAAGVAAAYLLVSLFNLAANGIAIFITIPSQIRNFLSLFPPGLIIFCFVWSSLVISRITLNEMMEKGSESLSGIVKLFVQYFPAAISVNLLVFLLLTGLLIAFGGIPIAGPVLFSLVFFFIYLMSLAMFVFLSVGLWFYPSIAVINNGDTSRSLRDFYAFIKKYNFRLGYVIPLMAISTVLSFLGLYGLHFGSLSLIQFISRNLLGEESVKIFSSIPGFLQQAAWASLFGADMGLFKSLTDGIFITHHIGGAVIGIIFIFLAGLLLSVLFSIIATLSANVYLLLERGEALEDAIELKLMAALVLMLASFVLLKKIFM